MAWNITQHSMVDKTMQWSIGTSSFTKRGSVK